MTPYLRCVPYLCGEGLCVGLGSEGKGNNPLGMGNFIKTFLPRGGDTKFDIGIQNIEKLNA